MQVRTGPANGMLSGRAENPRLVATEDQHYPYPAVFPNRGASPSVDRMWLEDRFTGPDLDPAVRLPHYLPAWSQSGSWSGPLGSWDETEAVFTIGDDAHLVPAMVVDRVAGDRA